MINPKSISVGELYGYSDPFTLEWKNGILARILLSYCIQTESELNFCKERNEAKSKEPPKEQPKDQPKDQPKEQPKDSDPQMSTSELNKPLNKSSVIVSSLSKLPYKSSLSLSASSRRFGSYGRFGLSYPSCAPAGWRWAMFDGPVDSEWIENLNSVLDDSMVLCLSNGERIRLLPGSRILFESDNLANASPATVSRCAVIFLVRKLQQLTKKKCSLLLFLIGSI